MADLLQPFRRRISSSSDADTAGKPAFNIGCHKRRRKKGERDRDVDVPDAATMFCRKHRDSFASIDNLPEPFGGRERSIE